MKVSADSGDEDENDNNELGNEETDSENELGEY